MNRAAQEGDASVSHVRPAIEIRNLIKRFGELVAIDDVSLSIEAGIFVTLLGPSGCGKSTLLRSIAGFSTPTSGTIAVGGRDITRELPHRRPVSMVFQDYALFPHMTVRQNIAFGCEMQGRKASAIAGRCDEMLALIHLPDIGDRFPAQLSGGQQQRVSLARALAPDPVSLLLDEPLGALDLKLRRQMQLELKQIQRRTGKTFLFVTHDQEEAMSMSDKIAVMQDGTIEQLDTPERIYRRPATEFVAGFIGDANLIRARVTGADGDGLMLSLPYGEWRIPRDRVTSSRQPSEGEKVTVVVRPEDMRLSGAPPKDHPAIEVRLQERTYLGGRVQLLLRDRNDDPLTAETREHQCRDLPETFWATTDPDHVAVLAQQSR